MRADTFALAVASYCRLTDGSITSWLRSRARNTAVGGVLWSAHLVGLAADVVYDAPLERAVRVALAARFGLRCIVESDHDHLQPVDWQK